jgi:hypothetical protein
MRCPMVATRQVRIDELYHPLRDAYTRSAPTASVLRPGKSPPAPCIRTAKWHGATAQLSSSPWLTHQASKRRAS